MTNNRDCPHGRRLGDCDTCDLAQAERRIAELTEQLRTITDAFECGDSDDVMHAVGRVIDSQQPET